MNDSEYKDLFNWLLGSEGINSIVKDIKRAGVSVSLQYLVGLFLSAGGNKILPTKIPDFAVKAISIFGKISAGNLANAGKYLLLEVFADMASSFSTNSYKKIKLAEIENSSAPVLERLNSAFNVNINSEMFKRTINAAGATMQMGVLFAATPFSVIFLMASIVSYLKQIFLIAKMTYTIKPALDMFMELLKRNPERYSYSMYEKTKNWKTGIWYLIKTNSMQRIQDIDMEPRYQLEYLKDTSDINDEEKAKSEQEGKSQLKECGWFEGLWKWTKLTNCQ